ncbi:MAG: StfH/YfcO family fimbrial adhesin [Escherichia coli]
MWGRKCGITSSCPVSVATYDISWSEDYVAHSKVLSLQSTGGTIEKTPRTFLMESGKLFRLDSGSDSDRSRSHATALWRQMIAFTHASRL